MHYVSVVAELSVSAGYKIKIKGVAQQCLYDKFVSGNNANYTLSISAINYLQQLYKSLHKVKYDGWNFNSGNYLFTTDTK